MILIEHTCISSDISTPSRLVMIIILSSYTNLWAHVCFCGLCHHFFRQWLILYSMPSHYLNQSCHLGNWTRLSKCQRWSFVKLIKICKYPFTNPFQNFVCKRHTNIHTNGQECEVLVFPLLLDSKMFWVTRRFEAPQRSRDDTVMTSRQGDVHGGFSGSTRGATPLHVTNDGGTKGNDVSWALQNLY